ncbi:MAG: 2Fe-2S iron-sulfur cluster binding domain-containing protein [Armatimonadetes bacterium]|nr:2Fe-2S iron-sulfur cluster binding domain-containing protein [Armatimonadota bacterium]
MSDFVIVDGKEVRIEGERNLLELIRKAGIDIPTFCYHSRLSVYGACRLCLVEVEGRGIVASCSTLPEPGLKVKTATQEIREIRKIAVELLLANHEKACPTCAKSAACQLQAIARRLGVDEVRFHSTHQPAPVDRTSPSLVRDPNKCILCGDCVRVCHEVQGIGAIDFAHRGAQTAVVPAFGKDLKQVECVYCGQCASVCPTGSLTVRSEIDAVWADLSDPNKTVVAQIAPAVRVALGEHFGMAPGTVTMGQIVAALKAMGFDHVYDTSFAADLTVIEEANEFLARKEKGERLPIFTSCCPAWVKFAEQYYPALLPHLSSCRSPQQMFGALAREVLPERLGVRNKELVVVSIMPCTAKKFEAKQEKFVTDGIPDVDHVLTTQELGRMIEERGLRFHRLEPESLDMPLGFKTGAGVIFGTSGGVTEAVLRYAVEKVSGVQLQSVDFKAVRGEEGLREATVSVVAGVTLKLAIVHGLANARRVAERVLAGECDYDIVEVMSCPGGCIGGAGQPVSREPDAVRQRARGLYNSDKMLEFHKSQDNYVVNECYQQHLGEVGGEKAHRLLHTHYSSRRRITDEEISLVNGSNGAPLAVNVCIGTSCMVRGSQRLLQALVEHIEERGLVDAVDVKATFCFERCDRGPTVAIGDTVIERCTVQKAFEALEQALAEARAPELAAAGD